MAIKQTPEQQILNSPPWRSVGYTILPLVVALALLGLVFTSFQLAQAAPVLTDPGSVTPEPVTSVENHRPRAPLAMDLSIVKTHNGDFTIGSSGAYTISVTNSGSDPVTGPITVTDVLTTGLSPAGASGQDWSPCGFSGQTLTCIYSNTAGLGSGVTLPPIRLNVNVGIPQSGNIVNTAVVSNTNDVLPSNNFWDDPTQILGTDLRVTKSVSPTAPAENQLVVYTVRVTNLGPNDAASTQITDTLPAGLTLSSSSASQGTYTNSSGIWFIGNLANGSSVTLTLNATINAGAGGNTIVNTARGLKSNQPDYNVANNTASASFAVASTQITGLVTDHSSNTPVLGATVVFTDSVSRVYTLTTSANGWYTFTSTAAKPIAPGSAKVTARKTGYADKTVTVTLTTGVSKRVDLPLDTSDLSVTVTDGKTTIAPGSYLTYTVEVSNLGTLPAANVLITDVLPTYLTYITDTLGITHSLPAAHTYLWKLPNSLAANGVVTFKVKVQVANKLPSPTTALTNALYVSTSSPEVKTSNNSAIDTTTSTGTPNVSITISVSPSQVQTGRNATYTIHVKNTGTAPATDVALSDTISTYLDIVSARTTKGTATTNNSTRKVTVSISVLSPDDDVTITIVARVNSTARSNLTVTNYATLTYIFGGSTYSRTSSSVSFQILVSSTLPGTGGIQLQTEPPKPAVSRSYVVPLLSSILLGVLGLVAFVFAARQKSSQPEWARWARNMGLLLTGAAIVFGLIGWGLKGLVAARQQQPAQLSLGTSMPLAKSVPDVRTEGEGVIYMPVYPTPELEKLPDFPIPTPTIPASIPPEKQSDTTAVSRIVIPAIDLDTIVKYVPYDGLTWLIAGLKQEVAWMGNTSWPGLGGNTALAGHVTLWDGSNGPFRYLSYLQKDDLVEVYTEENIYTYQVIDQKTVEQTDLSILDQNDKTQLTLITCTDWDTGIGVYLHRLVVRAELVDTVPIRAEARGN